MAHAAEASDTPTGLPPAAYRTLGRTGLEVTTVSIGTFRTTEPPVIRYALEQGINFIDTARKYHKGKNEGYVREALKGFPGRVYIGTKIVISSEDEMNRLLDTSLRELDVDCIDILYLHHLSSREQVFDKTARKVITKARDEGKVSFLAVSTHEKEVEVLDAMVEDEEKLYDVAMVKYNFKCDEALRQAIARASKAGIGIVGIKTQAGGYETKELGDITPHQAALKWVLQDPNVAAVTPSMVNLDQIKENVAVMKMDLQLTRAEQQVLQRYGRAIDPYYCHACGACTETCPYGVDIPTINRCLMYAEGYHDRENALAAYAEIPRDRSLAACDSCAICTAGCVRNVRVEDQIRRARELFA